LHSGKGRICLVCTLAQWLDVDEGQWRWGTKQKRYQGPSSWQEAGAWVPPNHVGHIGVQRLRAVASRYSLSTYKKELRMWWGTHTLLLCWHLSLKELRKWAGHTSSGRQPHRTQGLNSLHKLMLRVQSAAVSAGMPLMSEALTTLTRLVGFWLQSSQTFIDAHIY
jgi:hypothetical protein